MWLWSNPFHSQSLKHDVSFSLSDKHNTHLQPIIHTCAARNCQMQLAAGKCTTSIILLLKHPERHAVELGSSFGEALGFKSASLFFLYTCMVPCVIASGNPSSYILFFTLHISCSPSLLSVSRLHCVSLPLFSLSQTPSISPLFVSIHPSVSWQKMSHASSWEAKTLSPSFPLNISPLYFSSSFSMSLFSLVLTLLPALCYHVSLHPSTLFCHSTTALFPPSSLNLSHTFLSQCESHFCSYLYFLYIYLYLCVSTYEK